jgi:hypothetical protein
VPFETSFNRPRRLMITRAWGPITPPHSARVQQEPAQRPEFDATWAHIFDARDIIQFDISNPDIGGLAETSVLATWARRSMGATDPLTFGVFRMYGVARTPDGRTRDRRVYNARGSQRAGTS